MLNPCSEPHIGHQIEVQIPRQGCLMFSEDWFLKFCLNLENIIGRVTSSCYYVFFFVCFAFYGRD